MSLLYSYRSMRFISFLYNYYALFYSSLFNSTSSRKRIPISSPTHPFIKITSSCLTGCRPELASGIKYQELQILPFRTLAFKWVAMVNPRNDLNRAGSTGAAHLPPRTSFHSITCSHTQNGLIHERPKSVTRLDINRSI